VIEDRMAKGQLDRTDLTLKDLDTIRRSFVKTLKNMYHPRLRYPNGAPENEGPPEESRPPAEETQPTVTP